MWKFIKQFMPKPRPEYKIIYDEQLGYMPVQWCNIFHEYWGIDKHGRKLNNIYHMYSSTYHGYWHATEEGAGQCINRSSQTKYSRVIWQSPVSDNE